VHTGELCFSQAKWRTIEEASVNHGILHLTFREQAEWQGI
jgi:hypothetical protein